MQLVNGCLEVCGCLLLGELMAQLGEGNEDWSMCLTISAAMGMCGLGKIFLYSRLVVQKVGRNIGHDTCSGYGMVEAKLLPCGW